MTQFSVIKCDICTKVLADLSGVSALTYKQKNAYKTNGSFLLDLCDDCNAPLDEALRRRVAELTDK